MENTCPGCGEVMIPHVQWFYGPLGCHLECKDLTIKKMGERNARDLEQFRVNARLAQDGIVPGHHLFGQLGGK